MRTVIFPERQYFPSGIPGRDKEIREMLCRILLLFPLSAGVCAEIAAGSGFPYPGRAKALLYLFVLPSGLRFRDAVG